MTLSAHSQNLVPNESFESFSGKNESGYSDFSEINNWYNTNKRQNTKLFGTPDLLYRTGNEIFEKHRTSFKPLKGIAAAGLITYMLRVKNYREFISVKLNESLKKGEKYKLTFNLTCGDKTTFGSIGVNNFGAYFSRFPIEQFQYEPIGVTPQVALKNVFYDNEWTSFSFVFEAQDEYRYLTLGNFSSDENTNTLYIKYDLDPQAYYFIDEVSLEKHVEKSLIAENSKTIKKGNDSGAEKTASRKVTEQQLIPITESEIVVSIWDSGKKDGDIITLEFNNEKILKEFKLKKKKKTITLYHQENSENTLSLFAHNLGKEPPNTAAFTISSGGKTYRFNLRSDLTESGAVKFVKIK